jgi:hypothetical protein
MSLADLLNQLMPHPDRRTPDQIARDVDDEFEFHLASLESELAAAGAAPEQARQAAVKRFGDADKYRRQCERIAMEDRIMLQRINAVLMVIVLLAVIGVSVQMYLTQRNNSQALADITTQLASMKSETDGRLAEMIQAMSAPDAGEGPAVVYVDGHVVRPGVYGLPKNGSLSLARMLRAAGGLTTSPAHVMVRRSIDGKLSPVFDRTVSDLSEIVEGDVKLERDDVVRVNTPREPGPSDKIRIRKPESPPAEDG